MPAGRPERKETNGRGDRQAGGLLFAICARHAIMLVNAEKEKECRKMSEKKKAMARVLALVIAGIMVLSVALAVLLK